jgi:hypothetical protein
MRLLVPVRGPLARVLLWSGGLGAGALGVLGGLSLRAPGIVAVGLAATLAACTAAGIAQESSRNDLRTTIEAAVHAAVWTVVVLLVLSGIAVLAGGGVAALVVGTVLAGWLVRAVLRARPTRPAALAPQAAPAPPVTSSPDAAGLPSLSGPPDVPGPSLDPAGLLAPVWTLPTPVLGQEWLSTTAALAGLLDPAARASLVRRREEMLDELERRDPDGFARWLAVGPAGDSDPADHVHGGPVLDGPAADTDAV